MNAAEEDIQVRKKNKVMDENNNENNYVSNSIDDINMLLTRETPFGNETSAIPLGEFDPGNETIDFLKEECKILVVGAGGLGCEILKDLALSGFQHEIHVIDMDRIDVSNLNRQFLFREKDIGDPKATVAAAFINTRIPKANVIPHFAKIQSFDLDFYRQFNIIISGLDNIEARRWLNSAIVSLVDIDQDGDPDPSTIIPLVDGGTEGFKGQARVILPKITSCFECSLDAFPPQRSFPMCTIAETPRQPEHCIAYAYIISFPKQFPDKKLDTDSVDDMMWVFERAKERAEQYGIEGVTYKKTLGVVKNIIPAVASTNAIISAMCVNEVFKLMSYCSQTLHTYHMHMGSNGCYSHTFCYKRKAQCPVCSNDERALKISTDLTLGDLIQQLCHDPQYRLKAPSVSKPGANLFMQGPPALREATKINLTKKMSELVKEGEALTITDPIFVGDLALVLTISF